MVGSIVKTYESLNLSQTIDFPYVICSYIIWLSVELSLVMVVAWVPLLRSLFRNRSNEPKSRWKAITLGSVLPKSRTGGGRRMSTANVEYIMTPQVSKSGVSGSSSRAVGFENGSEEGVGGEGGGIGEITRTTEVSVTYETSDKPFVHAALVGLVQGGICKNGVGGR